MGWGTGALPKIYNWGRKASISMKPSRKLRGKTSLGLRIRNPKIWGQGREKYKTRKKQPINWGRLTTTPTWRLCWQPSGGIHMGTGSRAPACPDPPSVKRKAALKMDGLKKKKKKENGWVRRTMCIGVTCARAPANLQGKPKGQRISNTGSPSQPLDPRAPAGFRCTLNVSTSSHCWI